MAIPTDPKRLKSAVPSCEARFVSPIHGDLADSDSDDVQKLEEVEAWLAARRRVATPEEPR